MPRGRYPDSRESLASNRTRQLQRIQLGQKAEVQTRHLWDAGVAFETRPQGIQDSQVTRARPIPTVLPFGPPPGSWPRRPVRRPREGRAVRRGGQRRARPRGRQQDSGSTAQCWTSHTYSSSVTPGRTLVSVTSIRATVPNSPVSLVPSPNSHGAENLNKTGSVGGSPQTVSPRTAALRRCRPPVAVEYPRDRIPVRRPGGTTERLLRRIDRRSGAASVSNPRERRQAQSHHQGRGEQAPASGSRHQSASLPSLPLPRSRLVENPVDVVGHAGVDAVLSPRERTRSPQLTTPSWVPLRRAAPAPPAGRRCPPPHESNMPC